MALDKIHPEDSRVKDQYFDIKGHKWHYLDATPTGEKKGTIVLVHGFPDLALAWRYQIPLLLSLGMRCIVPDCMGYGETGASSNLQDYTFKAHADAIATLAKAINTPQIILGGHDWGGAVVYRTTQWYPDLVTHVFSVATPYFPVGDTYVDTKTLVETKLPNFGYQLQMGSEDHVVEKATQSDPMLRKVMNAIYGGKLSSGERAVTPEHGYHFDRLERSDVGLSPLFKKEEFDHYVSHFKRNGFEGPCNWYRTRKLNYEEELNLPAATRNHIKQPTLFVQAKYDDILIPQLSRGMEKAIPNLTRAETPTSHWALWQKPEVVNGIIKSWFEGVVLGGKSKI